MSPSPAPPRLPADALPRPLRRLLRPLVRLMIRAGVTFPVFSDLMRGLYVEVAADGLPADARSDSRLTLLTGVHRKEIRRIRESETPPDAAVPAVVTLNSQVLARWLGLPAYAAPDGAPRPLARREFDELVASVTTDVRPRTVLDSWVDQGVVTLLADESIRLNAAAFVPRDDRAAQLHYFARNLHDHIAAAAANIASDKPPFLERSLHYDGLSEAAAAQLEAEGRAMAQQMLVELNRRALSLLDQHPAAEGAPTRRVNLGVYLHVEDEPLP